MPAAALRPMRLQSGIIYGPVDSRRLGRSLGVNLLPRTYKLCSFNCLYCQYGWTAEPTLDVTRRAKDLPRPDEVSAALEKSLRLAAQQRTRVDAITFSGNGEPTLHPHLAEIVKQSRILRDSYLPSARLAILSNSSTVGKKEVREALDMLDLRIMKFDAGGENLVRHINIPARPFDFGDVVEGLGKLKDVILQSLFFRGVITNADPESLDLWLEKVREIRPLLVQVYTLDRVPATNRLSRVSTPTLRWIANQVRRRAAVPAEAY